MFGGSRWKCGYFYRDTWLFDPANDSWTRQITSDAPAGDFNLSFARDPLTNLVYARDTHHLYSYNPAHYHYLRECELDAALAQTRADLVAGRVVQESPEAHLARLDALSAA